VDSWAYCTRRGRARAAAMPAFEWTGELRPYKIGPPRAVPASIPRPDYAADGVPHSEVESKQQRNGERVRLLLCVRQAERDGRTEQH
jgi:methionyl aminopeptidase